MGSFPIHMAVQCDLVRAAERLQEVTERDTERETERAASEAKTRKEERERTLAAEKALDETLTP